MGDYQRAADEMRVSAFGLLDTLPSYEITQIYIALSEQRMGHNDEASKAVLQLVQAERVTPSFRSLPLDPAVRAAFSSALPQLFTPAQLTTLAVSQFLETGPVSAVAALPTDCPTLEVLLQKDPQSVPLRAALAEGRFKEGRFDDARQLAEGVLSSDPGNTTAHLVLARIAARENRSQAVISHLNAVRGVRQLAPDDVAALFVAYVMTGAFEEATKLKPSLTEEVRQTAQVQRALSQLQNATAPPASKAPAPGQAGSKPAPTSAARNPRPSASPPAAVKIAAQAPLRSTAAAPPPRTTPPKPTSLPDSKQPVAARGTTSPIQPTVPSKAVTFPGPASPPPNHDATSGRSEMLKQADQALAEGKLLKARELFLVMSRRSDLERGDLLMVARGLSQSGAFRQSEAAYDRAGRLRRGEEIHLFYKAVDFYELGDFPKARDYLRMALPLIPMTRSVAEYKAKIESTVR